MISISAAEAQVMEVLWQKSPQSTDDIAQALAKQQDWQLATIKTLLNRLLNKGAITAVQDGRRYAYSAVLQRSAWLAAQSTDLIDRVFGGHVAPLVAHFSQQRKLKAADIASLKALIKALERD